MLEYHRTTEAEKTIICDWRYDGPYAIYDHPPYAEQIKSGRGFANPENDFYSFVDGDRLIGFINLVEEASGVFFGIGVNPDCCGRGYGQQMTRTAIALSRRMYPGKLIYLEVRTWNARAVKCYQRAGFCIVGKPIIQTTSIGEGEFYRMVAD